MCRKSLWFPTDSGSTFGVWSERRGLIADGADFWERRSDLTGVNIRAGVLKVGHQGFSCLFSKVKMFGKKRLILRFRSESSICRLRIGRGGGSHVRLRLLRGAVDGAGEDAEIHVKKCNKNAILQVKQIFPPLQFHPCPKSRRPLRELFKRPRWERLPRAGRAAYI